MNQNQHIAINYHFNYASSVLLEEERDQREVLMNEMNKMKRQYVLSEERNQILLATISTLRKTIEEEAEKCNNLHKQAAHQEEISKAKYEVRLFFQ